jgi:small subunit ribosomal protein S9|tara:strand:+ start:107 stop:556 length:450 start_codon:yes stop_codon:yes gene_type:complete
MENIQENNNKQTKPKKIKLDFTDSKYATGRRKRSIARVWVKKGSGNIYVNGIQMNKYFKRPVHQIIVTRPLEISNVLTSYDVKCSVAGGGLSGQAGAIIHGLSRALVSSDESLKKGLKKEKLTTRDSRVVERKKYGRRKARRSFQFSKR